MSSKMTKEEREAFLADLHVGIIGIQAEGRGPVVVPVWYSYKPGGELYFLTNKSSHKQTLLEKAGRFTLCVQEELPPYRYVSVEGSIISIEKADRERYLRPLAVRYLGFQEGDKYLRQTEGDESVVVRMKPERWSSADYGKL